MRANRSSFLVFRPTGPFEKKVKQTYIWKSDMISIYFTYQWNRLQLINSNRFWHIRLYHLRNQMCKGPYRSVKGVFSAGSWKSHVPVGKRSRLMPSATALARDQAQSFPFRRLKTSCGNCENDKWLLKKRNAAAERKVFVDPNKVKRSRLCHAYRTEIMS